MSDYDYNWFGYGLEIITPMGTCFLQGDEASELYDQLEIIDNDDILCLVLSEYEDVCE